MEEAITPEFTIVAKGLKRIVPDPCACFNIHYSCSTKYFQGSIKMITNEVSVKYPFSFLSLITFPSKCEASTPMSKLEINLNSISDSFICKVLNYRSPFKL